MGLSAIMGPILKLERPIPFAWTPAAFEAEVSLRSFGRFSRGGSQRQVVQGDQHAREEHLVEVPAKCGFERQDVQRVAIFFRAHTTRPDFCGRAEWSAAVWETFGQWACRVGAAPSEGYRRAKTLAGDAQRVVPGFFLPSAGIGVGPSSFKIGLGVVLGLRSLRGPILKLERPTQFAFQLVGQVVQLGRLGQPIEMPAE